MLPTVSLPAFLQFVVSPYAIGKQIYVVCFYYIMVRLPAASPMKRGGVAQWVARLTHDRWIPVSREFEAYERPPLFP